MTLQIGILIFDGAEELDFVGPYEVFTMAKALKPGSCEVALVAEREAAIHCAKGMRVLPDTTTTACGKLDVLLSLVQQQLGALVINHSAAGQVATEALESRGPIRYLEPVWVKASGELSYEGDGYHVPLAQIYDIVQLLLEHGRLKVVKELPLYAALLEQLKTVNVVLTATGREQFKPAAGVGDDLLMAVALAAWWGENISPARLIDDTPMTHQEALELERGKRRIRSRLPKKEPPPEYIG